MDERDAVARLRNGDIGGLEALVARCRVRALRAAFLVTRDRALADDVVSAAFLKAYDRIGSFDTHRPFGPWFLRIVVNDASTAVASRDRDVSLEQGAGGETSFEDTIADQGPTLEELAEKADAQYAIGGALARLSPKQREAIVMHYYLELTQLHRRDDYAAAERAIGAREGDGPGTIWGRGGPVFVFSCRGETL